MPPLDYFTIYILCMYGKYGMVSKYGKYPAVVSCGQSVIRTWLGIGLIPICMYGKYGMVSK